METFGLK